MMGFFKRTTSETLQSKPEYDTTEATLRYYLGLTDKYQVPIPSSIQIEQIPAVVTIPESTPEQNFRLVSKGTLTGVATVAIVSALTPAFGPAEIARAAENTEHKPLNLNSRETTTKPEVTVIAVGAPEQKATSGVKPIAVSAESMDTAKSAPISLAAPEKNKEAGAEKLKISAAPVPVEELPHQPIAIAVPGEDESVDTKDEKVVEAPIIADTTKEVQPEVSSPIVTVPVSEPEKVVDTVVVQPIAVEAPKEVVSPGDQDNPDESVEPKPIEPIMPVKEPAVEEPKIEESDLDALTEEELKTYSLLKEIDRAIKIDGDINRAAAFIQENFYDKNKAVTAYDEFGRPIVAPTNSQFVTNVDSLILAFNEASKSRDDINYLNTTRVILAVLKAAGNNQDILKSPFVQNLIKDVKRPQDDYIGQLFDEQLKKAQELLSSDDGKLLNGFNEEYIEQLQASYGYVLLANLTDEQQAEGVQKIKHEEAEAARKAKEEADREAREQADRDRESGHENASNPSETLLLEAIDRAADRYNWSRNKRLVLKAGAELGVELSPLTGFGGNVAIESAGFNPIILERGFEDNPNRGLGLVQYTNYMGPDTKVDENGQAIGGRRTVYEAAARKAGFDPRSDTSYEFIKWQVKYIIDESKRREARDDPTKNEWEEFIKIKDPAKSVAFFRWNFERPGEPHAIRRERAGVKLYDQLHREVEKIKDEKARERARQEARERAREDGPTFKEAIELGRDWWKPGGRDTFQVNMKKAYNRVQCTAFVSYFTNRYVQHSPQRGNGHEVADIFAARSKQYKMVEKLGPENDFTIFSMSDGGAGHTGVILSIEEDGTAIIVESNVSDRIADATGILRYEDFGDKNVENWVKGQVNIEKWRSLDDWKNYWKNAGFSNFRYASPVNPDKIEKNFDKGSRF